MASGLDVLWEVGNHEENDEMSPNNIGALISHAIGPSRKFHSTRQFSMAADLLERDAGHIRRTGEVDLAKLRAIAVGLEANILDLFVVVEWVTVSDIYGPLDPKLEKALTIWHMLPAAERQNWLQTGEGFRRLVMGNQRTTPPEPAVTQEVMALPLSAGRANLLNIWQELPDDAADAWLESGEGLLRLLGMTLPRKSS